MIRTLGTSAPTRSASASASSGVTALSGATLSPPAPTRTPSRRSAAASAATSSMRRPSVAARQAEVLVGVAGQRDRQRPELAHGGEHRPRDELVLDGAIAAAALDPDVAGAQAAARLGQHAQLVGTLVDPPVRPAGEDRRSPALADERVRPRAWAATGGRRLRRVAGPRSPSTPRWPRPWIGRRRRRGTPGPRRAPSRGRAPRAPAGPARQGAIRALDLLDRTGRGAPSRSSPRWLRADHPLPRARRSTRVAEPGQQAHLVARRAPVALEGGFPPAPRRDGTDGP